MPDRIRLEGPGCRHHRRRRGYWHDDHAAVGRARGAYCRSKQQDLRAAIADLPASARALAVAADMTREDESEVASMVAFLASVEASYVSGSAYTIDGGRTAG
jgi:hypothetical protein